MNDDLVTATGNGSVEAVEAVLEQAGDVVERHLFRKLLLTILILAVAAVIVKKVLGARDAQASTGGTADPAPVQASEGDTDTGE